MSGGFYGADVAQLRQLATTMRTAGRKLDAQRVALNGGVAGTPWPGQLRVVADERLLLATGQPQPANRLNAQSRIDWLQNSDPEPKLNHWILDSGYPARFAAEQEAWQKRQDGIGYLQKVVDGKVRLAAYDPGAQSIVELLGTYDEDTTTVITYVPGTTTNEASFYDDDFVAASAPVLAAFQEAVGLELPPQAQTVGMGTAGDCGT